ncbi:porin [Pseudogulbenkiania ferrooxidans]|uniref:Porin Gram-negative type n=1 Tax=Pseudogulbenkiania ferrooxidans 2002 TaxID=279714 RepID=B9Z064_9NEIS|nr:porin [Pseudogulbenkiania ferrooxidans]EEG09947.1 porin Gram-negative type [Pseudogulbenkiania ferrooxidans 2002]
MKQKKNLIAALALGMTSFAYADVTLYGRIHMDLESTKAGTTETPSLSKVQNDASRIGFKGSEDLGNGLKAIWQVESGVSVDAGGGTWASRESFLGLSDATFGTLKAGNFLVPYDDLHYIAGNNFQQGTGISNDAAMWANGGDLKTGGFDTRLGNSISYQTPKYKGFSSRIQYSLTTDATNGKEAKSNGASVVSANVLYDDGPLRVGYGFQNNRDMQGLSSNFYEDGTAHMLAAGYVFGDFYLGGLYEHIKLENINNSGNDRSRNYYGAMASYTAGLNVFSAQFGKAASWTGAAGVADSGARMGSIAYNRILSKTTQVYALYTLMHNDDNAGYVLGSNAVQPGAGAVMSKQHSIAIGMWKNF